MSPGYAFARPMPAGELVAWVGQGPGAEPPKGLVPAASG